MRRHRQGAPQSVHLFLRHVVGSLRTGFGILAILRVRGLVCDFQGCTVHGFSHPFSSKVARNCQQNKALSILMCIDLVCTRGTERLNLCVTERWKEPARSVAASKILYVFENRMDRLPRCYGPRHGACVTVDQTGRNFDRNALSVVTITVEGPARSMWNALFLSVGCI